MADGVPGLASVPHAGPMHAHVRQHPPLDACHVYGHVCGHVQRHVHGDVYMDWQYGKREPGTDDNGNVEKQVPAYSYGLCSCGLHSYGLHSYGLYSHGLYSHGLYSLGLYNYGRAWATTATQKNRHDRRMSQWGMSVVATYML